MIKKASLLTIVLLFFASAAFGQVKKESLALFPFTGSDAQDGVAIASILANQRVLRNAFTKTTLITPTIMQSVGFEQKFQQLSGLTDMDSIFEFGKRLNASHVIAGYIAKLGLQNIILTAILDIESLQQIAGDYRIYTNIEDIYAMIPEIASKLASGVVRNTEALPGLSVPPFEVSNGVNKSDAETLAQILACELSNGNTYAVLPRTDSIEKVRAEHLRQRDGTTDQERIKRLGAGRNAQYVLSGSAQKLGRLNIMTVNIVNLTDFSTYDGCAEPYQDISQGVNLMASLSAQLMEQTPAATAATTQTSSGTQSSSSSVSALQSGATPASDFDWLSDGSRITIRKYKGSSTNVVIPDKINGKPVTSIGRSAFSGCTGLTSVTIPNSVTSIEGSAFSGCTGLTSVTIPNSVTYFGSSAFYGCTGLTSVTILNSVTHIGTISSRSFSVTSIQYGTFAGCTGLTSITIPNSVTSIGLSAFAGCTGLTSVTIPNSVTSIQHGAFYGCTGLTSITIPNSVTSIGLSAFSGCTGLTSVTIPNSVTSIEGSAFADCIGLREVTLSRRTSVSNGAFPFGVQIRYSD